MSIKRVKTDRGIRAVSTWYFQGRRYRHTLGYNLTRAEEEEERRAVEALTVASVSRPASGITFERFTPVYLDYMRERGAIDVQRNAGIIAQHLTRFNGRPLESLGLQDGLDYIRARRKAKAADGTIGREGGVLMAMLNLAVDSDYLDKNRLSRVPWPKYVGRERVCTLEELAALWEIAGRDLRRMILAGLCTGLREGKLLEIDAGWINRTAADGLWLELPEARSAKKGNPRKLPLNATAAAALQTDIVRLYGGRVFDRWADIDSFKKLWARACKKANITDLHFHDLRHTFSTWLRALDVDYEVRAALLGHSLKGATKLYDHDTPEWNAKLRHAVTRLEAHIGGTYAAILTADRNPKRQVS